MTLQKSHADRPSYIVKTLAWRHRHGRVVFLLNRGMCRFCIIFGRFFLGGGACPRFVPWDPPLKFMALPLVNRYMRLRTIDVGRIFIDGCIKLGGFVLQCSWGPIVSKSGPSCFWYRTQPLQGASASDLVLLSPLTLRKSSVGCRRPDTHPRKIRGPT